MYSFLESPPPAGSIQNLVTVASVERYRDQQRARGVDRNWGAAAAAATAPSGARILARPAEQCTTGAYFCPTAKERDRGLPGFAVPRSMPIY